MNIPTHLNRDETRLYLRRQISMGRYMVLGSVIITVINLILLLTHADFYITYSISAAYYLVWLGKGFDDPTFLTNGTYTVTALVLAVIILAVYLGLWLLAKSNLKWLKISTILLAVDTGLLLAFALYLGGDLMEYIWELVIHGAVLWEMKKALDASKQLANFSEAEAE